MKKQFKKILVTGGAGFIGSHLVESLLREGIQVLVVDNLSSGKRSNISQEAELIVEDIRNLDAMKNLMQDVDGCFHLAAIASVTVCEQQWQFAHETNLIGTLNVFDAAKAQKIPVIYASSAAVYGNVKQLPIVEDGLTQPISTYGADKLATELHARVASVVHQVPTMGFRFFNVYGPRQDPKSPYSGVISIFANKIQQQQAITIFGDGEQSRDFVYVGDVVRFLRAGLDRVSLDPTFYNVCTGRSTSIKQVADTIMEVTQNKVPVQFGESLQGDIRHSLGSPEKAKKELGITADTPLQEGLSILIESQHEEIAAHSFKLFK